MQALLSFDQSPPLTAPLRFLLTAPLYGVLAGALLMIEGADLLASRWTPAALAATHLLTLGFMLQIMLGALIQILPVVAGANLAQPARLAALVHPLLNLGCLLLVAGFLAAAPGLLQAAGVLLLLSIGGFLFAAARALLHVPSTSPTIRGLKLALSGLLVTAALGLVLLLALSRGWSLPLMPLTDLHAGWGLAGWTGILLSAVAYVVVPMFQLTPGYSARSGWAFPWLIIFPLLLWSLAFWCDWVWLAAISQFSLALVGIAFCLLTLRLQSQRRRPRPDVTLHYWQLGLGSLISALLMLLTAAIWPALSQLPMWSPLFGVLVLVGGFIAFINGMLYKIAPFLAWLHLQNRGSSGGSLPAMNKFLSEAEMRQQMRVFFAAFGLLTAACLWPEALARPAGLVFMLANAGLGWNLWRVVRRYRRFCLPVNTVPAV
ncbi:hypothetical protein [Azonexus sp.]|uniref:hypothetical protein n=1 Tax=Azonexus sp. TaxID=1872668 RepID=UPI0027B9A5A1|nr:hypothetical protein [Azonexus sp.]